MRWEQTDILKILAGGGLFTALVTFLANIMGWVRFGKKDVAEVGKVKSETALDIATIAEKKASDEVKISNAALQWTVNLSARLEKEQMENDRLHSIIDTLKNDWERDVKKMKDEYDLRIKILEEDLERVSKALTKEREENMQEIKRLKDQINASR